ncbi:thiol:disulfide interchange protein DsbA/DsbL [Azohydromonas caseinilytica]|uniref:Thiol:disulfide interchange protein n=1 Tax=Azohydromonas caseinilytica TaxID=2728836 RepID=A0A848FK60_9BURK|nr:thiol:disulfide interchange protein DsbA/DsbL [Azohydromonas caseinilytica]NML18630.1 thiol:disulfide interchange protein DsbA/DsbL [Azohydromonas caseinilytica]
MKRREFACALAATGLALGGVPAAQAQASFAEGKDYVKLATPAPTSAQGKIEVVEFFWYGCPHCNAFEPLLDAWSKKVPDYVAFRRVPVGFTALHETHARLFYALEALQQVEAMHRKVFAAMHQQRKRLDKEADIVAFMTENGVDGAKFTEAFKSFGVATKVRQAKALTDAYKIDGVPSMGIQGRYFTSGALAGSNERALATTEYLIGLARKSG